MTFIEQLKEDFGKRLMIGGHRGHLSNVRENTIENYKQVLGTGISHIEIDIQLTRDDVTVIYHDFDLSENSPLTGKIRDYTLAELKAAFPIDTLDETVAWCRENGQAIAFELKSRALDMYDYMPEIARQLADTIAKYDFYDMCFVFSTDYRTLRMVKELQPRTPLGLIVPIVPADPVALMREMDAIIYLTYIDSLSPEIVAQLHDAGYYVDGSVINTKDRLEKALELGVDLIESDHPVATMELYKELSR
ncbi:MAG: glycerophosphodiester phosphodiesterase [Clostridiales bacterium]|nr:glycerophosphodiester phosphodiesterase [Clostridiales bacterium]